jgi:hypothetical protein
MHSGYLPNSPIMANDVDRFPTPNMYLKNLRWTCSCFKLLNSFEIKLFFQNLLKEFRNVLAMYAPIVKHGDLI